MHAAQTYIVAYNLVQTAGWAACLLLLVHAAATGGSTAQVYEHASSTAVWFQLLAFMEVVHAATGLVRSSAASALMQWLGRSNALIMIAQGVPELHSSMLAPTMLACFSIGEITRYPWYALTTLDACPYWLTWIRYTAFILLYPAGMASEVGLMYKALPYLRQRGQYNINMPNSFNFGFRYDIFIMVVLAIYPFLWWQLYTTLLRQRKKRLGSHSSTASAARGKSD